MNEQEPKGLKQGCEGSEEYPVVGSREDLKGRDDFSPAYVLVPADLVEPVFKLVSVLVHRTPQGELARGIQLLLIGFDEEDSKLQVSGVKQVVNALIDWGVLPWRIRAGFWHKPLGSI